MTPTFKAGDIATHGKTTYLVVSSTIMTRNDGVEIECVGARRWIKKTAKWSGNAYSYGASYLTKVEPLDEDVGYNDYCSRF